MCEPVSAIAGLALSAIGTGVGAYGAYQSGQAQATQAEYQSKLAARNARQAQYQADYERAAAKEEAGQHRRQVGQAIGSQKSLLAASGVDLSDPDSSAMSILGDTAQWGEYDAQKILQQGDLKAWSHENQSASEQANSLIYGRGAKQSSYAGTIGAGASLLSGAGQVAGQWYQYNKDTKEANAWKKGA